jgi:hypothetical protein
MMMKEPKTTSHALKKLHHEVSERIAGFNARKETIYNGKIVAEELSRFRSKLTEIIDDAGI